jgi:hypothetical protein
MTEKGVRRPLPAHRSPLTAHRSYIKAHGGRKPLIGPKGKAHDDRDENSTQKIWKKKKKSPRARKIRVARSSDVETAKLPAKY